MTEPRVVPRLAEWILACVLPRSVRDALLADLAAAAANPRRRSPRLWYWRQTLSALWPPTLIALHLDARGRAASTIDAGAFASVGADLRFTARRLRRRPLLAVAVVALLAVGVTSGAVVFSIFSELLHPHIGVPDPARLYTVTLVDSAGVVSSSLRAHWIDAIDEVAGDRFFASSSRDGVVRFDGAPVNTRVAAVSPRYFERVGVRPVVGRLPSSDTSGGRAEALVSYRLWTRLMGGDPAAIGKIVTVNRRPYMIAGIAPPSFDGPDNGLIWVPAAIASANQRPRPAQQIYVRVTDDQDATALAASICTPLLRAVMTDLPSIRPPTVRLTRLSEARSRVEANALGDAARTLGLLSLLVLVAACANTANVLVMDVFQRSQELAVRSAIGGGRGRIAWQLCCEYGSYGILAAVAAIGTSMAAIRSMPLWLPIDAESAARWNLHANAVAVVLSVVALGLVLVIALPISRAMRIVSSLRAVGISARSAPGRSLGVLVSVQVAQTVVLLTAAVTLWRSETFARDKPLGFDVRSSAVLIYALPRAQYDSAATIRFQRDLLRALATTPGTTAAIAAPTPIVGRDQASVTTSGSATIEARKTSVSSAYFAAMGTRFVEGRTFGDDDANPQVVVSRRLAAALAPAGSPIGRPIRIAGDSAAYLISGVVEDGTYGGAELEPHVFVPASRRTLYAPTLIVRSPLSRREIERVVADAARAIDPDVPVTAMGSLATLLDRARLLSVIMRDLAFAFCVLAIVVSGLGLFIHLSRHVSARTAELGLRLALGASPARMIRDVVSHSGRMAGAGLIGGIVLSIWVSAWLSKLMFGVRRSDPVVIAWVVGATALIAVIAAAIPSWRAARINPAKALAASSHAG